MAETVGEGQIVIGADTSNLDTDLQKKVSKSGEKGGGFFSTGFGKAMKVGVIGTVTAVGATAASVFGTAMSKGFARAGAIEDAQAKLRGLGHEAESVESIMDNVRDSVTGTAYGLGEATTVAANMVAAGIEPGEKLTATLATLADTASITGVSFDEMGSIFSKMAANGKLTGEEMAQLTDRGLPVLQMLQDKYNLTAEEAQKWVKDGKVSFEMFRELMEENIGDAAENAGQTFSGASANIGAALGRLGEMFSKPIMDTLRDSFNAAIPALDATGKLLDPLAEKFGDVLADQVLPRVISGLEALPGILLLVSDGLSGIKSILVDGEFTEQFASAFNVEEDSPIVDTLLGIREALSGAWDAAKEFFDGFVEGFGGTESLVESILPIFTMLQGPLGILKTVLVELFEQIDFEQFGKLFGSTFKQIAEVLVELSGTVGELVSELVSKLVPVFMDLIEAVLPPVMGLIGALVPVILQVIDAVLPLVDTLLTGLVPVFAMIVKAIAPVIAQLVEMLVPVILNIAESVIPALIKVFDAVNVVLQTVVLPILSAVVDFLAKTFTSTFENLKPLIQTVFDFIQRTIDNAMNVIKGIIDVVLGVISGDWDRAWEGIKSIASAVWDQLKNIVSTAIDLVKGYITFFIDQVTSAWGNFWTSFKGVGEAAWNWIRDTALGVWDYLAEKTKDAFNGIKDAVEDIWNGIKKVVGTPINAVIRFVNDGIIGGYNTIANALSLSTLGTIRELTGFASGGYVNLPRTSKRDPYLGITGLGQMFRFEGEEFIVNRERTKRNRKLLEAINAGLIDQSQLPGFSDGGIVSFRGHKFTALFASLLREAERMAGRTMHISQGGFRPRTSYSGTSHQGDAVDITGNHQIFIPFLRKLGIAAWDRTGKGDWVSHTHGVPLPGYGRAAGSAIWQAQDYLRGGDGLGGRDNGPRGGVLSGVVDGLLGAFKAGFDTVAGWFNDIVGGVKDLFDGLDLGAGMFGKLFGAVGKKLMDGFIDWAKDKLNPFDGGEEPETPVRGYAGGTSYAFPGLALVGEGGRPELVDFRGGERVYSAAETSAMTRQPIARLSREDIDLLARTIVGMAQATSSRTVDSAFLALGRGV